TRSRRSSASTVTSATSADAAAAGSPSTVDTELFVHATAASTPGIWSRTTTHSSGPVEDFPGPDTDTSDTESLIRGATPPNARAGAVRSETPDTDASVAPTSTTCPRSPRRIGPVEADISKVSGDPAAPAEDNDRIGVTASSPAVTPRRTRRRIKQPLSK